MYIPNLAVVLSLAAVSQALTATFFNQEGCPGGAGFASSSTLNVCSDLPQSNSEIPLSISASGSGNMLICLEPGCSDSTPGSECQLFAAPFSCIDLLENPTNTGSFELTSV